MSTIVRVSYERTEELDAVVRKLTPGVWKIKTQPAKGKYKLAYIEMRELPAQVNECTNV